MWGETLRCTVTHRDIIPVITITSVLLFIPIGFYVGLAVYGTKKHRKVIQGIVDEMFYVYPFDDGRLFKMFRN